MLENNNMTEAEINGNIQIDITNKCNNYDIKDVGLLSSIRHRLKNQLNYLTLAEYEYYGNNDIVKSIASDIDLIIHDDFLFQKIELNKKD